MKPYAQVVKQCKKCLSGAELPTKEHVLCGHHKHIGVVGVPGSEVWAKNCSDFKGTTGRRVIAIAAV